MEITEFTADRVDAVQAFLGRIPAGESAFFKEDVSAPDTAKQWIAGGADRARYLAVEDGEVVGLTAVIPGAGWSSHVGEVRLVVDPNRRRSGVGRHGGCVASGRRQHTGARIAGRSGAARAGPGRRRGGRTAGQCLGGGAEAQGAGHRCGRRRGLGPRRTGAAACRR